MDMDGRSAIVTGGAGGLGAATVRHLHDVGLGVAIFDRAADRSAELAKELGDSAVAVGGDVNDDDDVAAAIEAARSVGTLSLVVNIAGGATGGGRTLGRDGTPHDKAVFVDTMAMNAFGTFNVTRLAAAAMAGNEPDEHGQRGVVVNTASIAGIEGQTGQLAYAAAKGAIREGHVGNARGVSGRRGGLPQRALVMVAVGALAGIACGGDDDDDGAGTDEPSGTEADAAATELLGPEDPASGEPVRIGMVSDGATDAFDNTDELRAAEATGAYWNEHRGGVGGRPVEVVTCETGADPGGATDCANQMVEEGVVAVALSQSAVGTQVWEPLHAAGVPTLWFQTSGQEILLDTESSFVILNPLTTLFGLPISVAENEDADSIQFVIIDVPEARQGVETLGPSILGSAGLDYDVVPIPVGTADMTSQMQQVAGSGAGVVHITGNDAFCIAAFNGLSAVGYDGSVAAVSQCITDATREAVAGDVLDGTYITSSLALGAEDDPTFQLYEAVMATFGEDVGDVGNFTAMGGYVAMASLLTSLEEISGDITPETVIETIKTMPEQELPGGGGIRFQCGGSAIAMAPSVCTNEGLRTTLDAERQPTTYEVVDSTEILP